MIALDKAILVARGAQIVLALIAFSVSIVATKIHSDYSRNHDWGMPNGLLMMAAIMTLFDNAALGCLGILAVLRPQDLARWLMLVFDVLALTAAVAAGKCIADNWCSGWEILVQVAQVFAYLSAVPIVLTIGCAIYRWRQDGEGLGQIRLPEEPRSSPTMEDMKKLEKRVEQLEAEARASRS